MIDLYRTGNSKNYDRLVDVIRSCISHNYMTVNYEAKQGKPGNRMVVMYLNRLLCAHFDLPLGRGGWRPKTPNELYRWLDRSASTRQGGRARS